MFKDSINKIVVLCVGLLCIDNYSFEVSSTILQRDKDEIKNDILGRVTNDIEKSKGLAARSGGYIFVVDKKVYDSRPLEFFDFFNVNVTIGDEIKNKEERQKRLEEEKQKKQEEIGKFFDFQISDPNAAPYIQKGIEDFFIEKEGKVSKQNLGDFLFGRLVDNMTTEEAKKEELKEDPKRMNDFVKETGPIRDQYMKLNVWNLSIQYYLELRYNDLTK